MTSSLLTVAGMRAADAATIAAGVPGIRLMERAGRAVADHAARLLPARGRVLIACGSGNNGGDGFVAARILAGRGYAVTLAGLTDRAHLQGDAVLAASLWDGPVHALEACDPESADLIIDALFGSGLSRAVDGAAAAFIARMAASGRPVLAVDVPSGLDGDTGQVRGCVAPATATVTFAARKPGHLLMPGRSLCGEVTVADIGISDLALADADTGLRANGPALWRGDLPFPAPDAHKFMRGHALVLSGGATATGAARLAARAALRAGAGLVTLLSPREALAVNAAHLTAIMLSPCDSADELAARMDDPRVTAFVLGPGAGVGPELCALVSVALAASRAVVLDADALTSFAGDLETLARLIASSPAPVVLTPHEGEFARLFGDIAGSKLQRAQQAAGLTGAIIVLKGPDTVIAAPDGRAAINTTGTPYLATAGSGDVLAGIIAGLIAQGMSGYAAACAGVWLHGRTGERLSVGLIAEDLPDALPGVLRQLS